ncbi:hypothetical protein INS49_005836 [Diaporthe citri]|uniref:uncharacterized protein n=1 Tax=Diaporthe citri TaxID=83186 RepID=UPI001C82520B|nr:uncharacterized protein INS49_005836 [Diaporthe citri]KAG6364237.1 hypothetical protein INS49_005836 [Diaporthe citri]
MMQKAAGGITKAARGPGGERPCPGPDRLPELQQAEQEVLPDAQDKGRTMLPITSHGKPVAFRPLLFGGATEARRMTDRPTKQSRTEPWGECPGRPAGLLLLYMLHPPRICRRRRGGGGGGRTRPASSARPAQLIVDFAPYGLFD